MFRRYFKTWAALFLIFLNLFIFYVVNAEESGWLKVYFLDIGQGDAILIKSPAGKKMLIDGGSSKSSILSEISETLPFYDHSIDVVLSTHPDEDHIGGLTQVLRNFEVGYVVENGATSTTRTFSDLAAAIAEEKPEKILARRGLQIDLGGGAVFLTLFPDRDVSQIASNDASIVGKLIFGEHSVLLTGDSSIKIENYLVSLDGDFLKSDVLKAGHHGSKTASAANFIKTVKPQFSVISAGKDNKYGHPDSEVIKILENQGSKILKTFEDGAILFLSDGENFKIK